MEDLRQSFAELLQSISMYQADDFKLKAVSFAGTVVLGYALSLGLYRFYIDSSPSLEGSRAEAGSAHVLVQSLLRCLAGRAVFSLIARMHQQYGSFCSAVNYDTGNQLTLRCILKSPVVRISPNEVHFNGPDLIDVPYPGAAERKTNRPVMVGKRSGTPHSMTATQDYHMHRRCRAVLNPFFSVASVRKLESVIRQHTDKVLHRLDQAGIWGEPMEMNPLFKAYASDTIVQYVFGDCFHFIDEKSR